MEAMTEVMLSVFRAKRRQTRRGAKLGMMIRGGWKTASSVENR